MKSLKNKLDFYNFIDTHKCHIKNRARLQGTLNVTQYEHIINSFYVC